MVDEDADGEFVEWLFAHVGGPPALWVDDFKADAAECVVEGDMGAAFVVEAVGTVDVEEDFDT